MTRAERRGRQRVPLCTVIHVGTHYGYLQAECLYVGERHTGMAVAFENL